MMESMIKILPYLLAVIIPTAIVVYLYKYLGWKKTIFLAIAATLVDLDHFLFGSKGFLEHPENGEKILHGFNYGIEFTIIVILLNVFIGRHLMEAGFKNWIFPSLDKFKSKKYYYFTWTARIILLGMLLHYVADLPIYLVMSRGIRNLYWNDQQKLHVFSPYQVARLCSAAILSHSTSTMSPA